MLLLRFRFENHRSFRGPSELTLVQKRLKTSKPLDGEWSKCVWNVAGVYGANASGKSALFTALDFMVQVMRFSATAWTEQPFLPHSPFALDEDSGSAPSHYAVDFVVDNIRYEYGFSLTPQQITSEWLYDYAGGRRRLLFERLMQPAGTYKFGRSLTGGLSALEKITGPRELFLSRGGTSHHRVLRPLFLALTQRIQFAEFTEIDRAQRIQKIVTGLVSGQVAVADLVTLLKVADVGISAVGVAETEVPEPVRRVIAAMLQAGASPNERHRGDNSEGSREPLTMTPDVAMLSQNLRFQHLGSTGKLYPLDAGQQSTGTLSWLALAVPSLETLRQGGVLLIDEIDASLHPQLAQVLIEMFKDRSLNTKAAQLIFTTHDTYFLSGSGAMPLDPEEIWFVEKDGEGASELYSLDDFPHRTGHNIRQRYLGGRYGAVPSVAPAFLHGLLTSDSPALTE